MRQFFKQKDIPGCEKRAKHTVGFVPLEHTLKLTEDQTFLLLKILITQEFLSPFLHFHIRLKTIMADNQFLGA